jgi:serine/threonine protein kinase
VTNDDAVKVLDFGLAKALEGDPSSIDISTSPTISRMATMQGVLLGTAAYMSPEQAKAKTVDRSQISSCTSLMPTACPAKT